MKQLLATALLVTVASSAFAAKFGEAPGDLNAPMSGYGNPNADLIGLEITNSATEISFRFTTNSNDITNPNWIKLNLAIRGGAGPLDPAGNGWARAYGMTGGANRFIGGWVDSGGGFEFRTFDGTGWGGINPTGATWQSTPGMVLEIAGGSVTYRLPLDLFGLGVGDSFIFDATTTGGMDPDGAWDPISITRGQITAPDQSSMLVGDLRYTLTATPAAQTVTLPVTFQATEASWAAVATRGVNYKVRQGGFIVASGFINATSSASNFVMEVPAGVTGPVVIEVDGAQFLRRLIPANLTGSNVTLGSQLVMNGDVDDNGEVDLTDIDMIIAAYLTAGSAALRSITDLDNNGEVDLTDIDIAIGNYLLADD